MKRYDVRYISEGEGIQSVPSSHTIRSFASAAPAKRYAERHAHDYCWGTAIVDTIERTIDWGNDITDFAGKDIDGGE